MVFTMHYILHLKIINNIDKMFIIQIKLTNPFDKTILLTLFSIHHYLFTINLRIKVEEKCNLENGLHTEVNFQMNLFNG